MPIPPVEVVQEKIEIKWATKADHNIQTLLRDLVYEKSEEYGVDYKLATSIITCEGGWENPRQCNGIYGCIAGQGHFQFIPSTWNSIIEADFTPIPDYCRTKEGVFISECNLIAGVWLLSVDGDTHWRTWSGHCYLPLLNQKF